MAIDLKRRCGIQGSLMPQFSVDQYGATLANWFGLRATQINDVFLNIGNFSIRNIGFLG